MVEVVRLYLIGCVSWIVHKLFCVSLFWNCDAQICGLSGFGVADDPRAVGALRRGRSGVVADRQPVGSGEMLRKKGDGWLLRCPAGVGGSPPQEPPRKGVSPTGGGSWRCRRSVGYTVL